MNNKKDKNNNNKRHKNNNIKRDNNNNKFILLTKSNKALQTYQTLNH